MGSGSDQSGQGGFLGPTANSPGGGSGVQSVTGIAPIFVDNTDPQNPVVELGNAASIPQSDLILWLDANKDVTLTGPDVTAWGDQSVQGNNATETRTFPVSPTTWPSFDPGGINGFPSVNIYDDETHAIGLTAIPAPRWLPSAQNWCMAAVVKFRQSAGGVIFAPEFDGISIPRASLAALVQSGQQMVASSTTGGFTAVPFTDGIVNYQDVPIVVLINSAVDVVTAFVNGAPRPHGSFIGSDIIGPTSYMLGTAGGPGDITNVGELLFFKRSLNADEQANVTNYLASKWLVPLVPYAPITPSVVMMASIATDNDGPGAGAFLFSSLAPGPSNVSTVEPDLATFLATLPPGNYPVPQAQFGAIAANVSLNTLPNDATIQLYKNNVATGELITIPAGHTGLVSDLGRVTYSAGDTLRLIFSTPTWDAGEFQFNADITITQVPA